MKQIEVKLDASGKPLDWDGTKLKRGFDECVGLNYILTDTCV